MNLGLTDTQELLRQTAQDFLSEACPPSLVKQMAADDRGLPESLWKEIAELGWTGLLIDEQYGGLGGSIVDAVLLYETIGRHIPPVPIFVSNVLSARILAHAGSDAQKQEWLPKLAAGEAIFTVAYVEPSASWNPASIATRANGDTLSGTKLFVHDAHIADRLIVFARTGDGATDVAAYIVDPKDTKLTALVTLAGDKQFEVVLDGVKGEKLPGDWNALDTAMVEATVVKAAEMVGGAQKALDMAVEYAKTRIAFGRPIGAFQAIQHKCANVATMVEGLRMLVWEAAWKIDQGIPAALDVAVAKDYAGTVYRNATTEAHLIFAGLAYVVEHDLHLYHYRVLPSDAMLGDSSRQQERIAVELKL